MLITRTGDLGDLPRGSCLKTNSRLCKWALPFFLLALSHVASANDIAEAPPGSSSSALDLEFAQAVDTFKAGEYSEALASFLALSARTPSPNVQLYVGYCYVQLGHPTDAHRAFSNTLERVETSGRVEYAATRDAARQQLAALDQQLAKLTISLLQAPRNAVVKLDGKALDPSRLGSRLAIEPGVHVIEAEAPGVRAVEQSVALERGNAKTVALLLRPPQTQQDAHTVLDNKRNDASIHDSRLTTLGWAAAGLGAVGWSVFAVAGFRAKDVYKSLQRQCESPCSDTTHRRDVDIGKSWQTAADVGLSIGIIGVVSATTLFIWGNTGSGEQVTHANLKVGSGSAQLVYEGRF